MELITLCLLVLFLIVMQYEIYKLYKKTELALFKIKRKMFYLHIYNHGFNQHMDIYNSSMQHIHIENINDAVIPFISGPVFWGLNHGYFQKINQDRQVTFDYGTTGIYQVGSHTLFVGRSLIDNNYYYQHIDMERPQNKVFKANYRLSDMTQFMERFRPLLLEFEFD